MRPWDVPCSFIISFRSCVTEAWAVKRRLWLSHSQSLCLPSRNISTRTFDRNENCAVQPARFSDYFFPPSQLYGRHVQTLMGYLSRQMGMTCHAVTSRSLWSRIGIWDPNYPHQPRPYDLTPRDFDRLMDCAVTRLPLERVAYVQPPRWTGSSVI